MKLERLKEIVDTTVGMDISVKKRLRHVVYYRYIYFKIAREELIGLTTDVIGASLNRDHSTVIHGLKKIEHELKYNKEIEKLYVSIKNKVHSELHNDVVSDLTGLEYDNFITSLKEGYEKQILDLTYQVSLLTKESTKPQNRLLESIKQLNDSDIAEFTKTRLTPYVNMLKSRVKPKVIHEVRGAILER